MTDNELGATVFGFILVGFIGFLFIDGLICYFIEKHKEKKYKKLYPEVFDFIDKLKELQCKNSHYYFSEVDPLEKQIDDKIARLKYLPKSNLKESEKELEEIKIKLLEKRAYFDSQAEIEKSLKKHIKTEISKDEKFKKYIKNLGWFREE